jgi:arylsulfatase A-like enzyme
VAATDAVIGDLIEELQQLGVYDRAVILFLSDHGEGLGEHGEDEHGLFLYRSTLQVPLIMKLPQSARAGLGLAYAQSGRLSRAIDHLETYASRAESGPRREQALAMVQQMRSRVPQNR